MNGRLHSFGAAGIRLVLDLAVGHVRSLAIERDGRHLTPLHTASWVDDPVIAEDREIAPNLRFLSGDFFCAPFGRSDVEEAPPHGWPANWPWQLLEEESDEGWTMARFLLSTPVMGARLVKEITLRDHHPFMYVRHVFTGGQGALPVASHAMTRFAGGGRLSFSPKEFAELPDTQQESDPSRGRSVFAAGVRFTDLGRMPLADGTIADLRRYPIVDGHEDFVMLVEQKGAPFGWAAAVRADEGDVMLSLKNPSDFPVTFLWFSNGGRYYKPWNRRHVGVLGIEEGRSYAAYGHAASVAANPLSEAGVPTALVLVPDGTVSVGHVVGGLPLPDGWREIREVEAAEDRLTLTGDDGRFAEVPFDGAFLRRTI